MIRTVSTEKEGGGRYNATGSIPSSMTSPWYPWLRRPIRPKIECVHPAGIPIRRRGEKEKKERGGGETWTDDALGVSSA